jgi:hypothetical protein
LSSALILLLPSTGRLRAYRADEELREVVEGFWIGITLSLAGEWLLLGGKDGTTESTDGAREPRLAPELNKVDRPPALDPCANV